jgi:phage/plasmid-like protein (TIGR03299 family)
MAHEVETMMYAGERPWHGLGTHVGDREVTSEQAIVAAGLDWSVSKQPLFTMTDDGVHKEVDGHYAIVRDTDHSTLGVVQGKYQTVQNSRKFSFIDQVLGSGIAAIHTAGSLKNGRIVWVLAKLAGIARVKGTDDTIERFFLLSSSHDGSMPIQAQFTPVRVVCQNTLNQAFHNRTNILKIRHTSSAEQQFKLAEKTVHEALEFYSNFELKVNWLADQRFNDLQMDLALNKVFNVTEDDAASTRSKNYMEKIKELAVAGRGNAQWAGTAFGAWQGFTEFADWEKTVRGEDSNPDSRLFGNWFGTSATLKQKAFDAIHEVLGVSP